MEILPTQYELASVIADLVNMIRDRAEKKGLKLEVTADEVEFLPSSSSEGAQRPHTDEAAPVREQAPAGYQPSQMEEAEDDELPF